MAFEVLTGEKPFSIFDEMKAVLQQRPGTWAFTTDYNRLSSVALVLGDRFDIPYDRLRALPSRDSIITNPLIDEGQENGSSELRSGNDISRSGKPLVNYFQGSHRLTLKASMAKLLRDDPACSQFMPQSFVLGRSICIAGTTDTSTDDKLSSTQDPKSQSAAPTRASFRKSMLAAKAKQTQQDERDAFLQAATAHQEKLPAGAAQPLWIVKPSAGCKGKGITITGDPQEVIAIVDQANVEKEAEQQLKKDGDDRAPLPPALFAVQRYIANPFLLGGRKFDIRIWVLVVSPAFDIYIFSQGSCRTASKPYDSAATDDVFAHLTNHDIQENAPDYGKYEAGNELWYSALAKEITASSHGTVDGAAVFEKTVRPRLNDAVVKSLLAAKDLMELPTHGPFECFQLLGFDVMLDADLDVHLIEINGSPGAAKRWLAPMVDGLVRLLVDPRFPPQEAVPPLCDPNAGDGERGEWVKVHPPGA